MERCAEVSKEVQECSYRQRGPYRVSRCHSTDITQTVCVQSESSTPTREQLDAAIAEWRKITHVKWAIHGWYSVVYPANINSGVGQPSEILWK